MAENGPEITPETETLTPNPTPIVQTPREGLLRRVWHMIHPENGAGETNQTSQTDLSTEEVVDRMKAQAGPIPTTRPGSLESSPDKTAA